MKKAIIVPSFLYDREDYKEELKFNIVSHFGSNWTEGVTYAVCLHQNIFIFSGNDGSGVGGELPLYFPWKDNLPQQSLFLFCTQGSYIDSSDFYLKRGVVKVKGYVGIISDSKIKQRDNDFYVVAKIFTYGGDRKIELKLDKDWNLVFVPSVNGYICPVFYQSTDPIWIKPAAKKEAMEFLLYIIDPYVEFIYDHKNSWIDESSVPKVTGIGPSFKGTSDWFYNQERAPMVYGEF